MQALPADERERLAHLFKPAAIGAARMAERNDLLGMLAQGRTASAIAVANELHAELLRFAASPRWRYGAPDPEGDVRGPMLRRLLTLTGGEVPGAETIRKTLGTVRP